MFRIEDLNFDITNATLDAFIDDDCMQINWGIEIKGVPKEKSFHGREPRASSEVIYKSKPNEIEHWLSLAGKKICWKPKYDEDGEMFGSLYFFRHLPIYDSTLEFLQQNGGLNIKWKALCDVEMEPPYDNGLEFYIDTDISFTGIWCGRKTELECYELLDMFFPRNLFEYTVTERGVSLLIPR